MLPTCCKNVCIDVNESDSLAFTIRNIYFGSFPEQLLSREAAISSFDQSFIGFLVSEKTWKSIQSHSRSRSCSCSCFLTVKIFDLMCKTSTAVSPVLSLAFPVLPFGIALLAAPKSFELTGRSREKDRQRVSRAFELRGKKIEKHDPAILEHSAACNTHTHTPAENKGHASCVSQIQRHAPTHTDTQRRRRQRQRDEDRQGNWQDDWRH